MIKTIKFNGDIKAINNKLPERYEVTKAIRTIGQYQVERIILLDKDRIIGELKKDDTVILNSDSIISIRIIKAKRRD